MIHIPKEIQISVIHSSSNTHSPVSLTVSPSLLLIHSLTLFLFSSLSLFSHFWQSHQLLHPKVTANTQYVPNLLHSVMESKIKTFSNIISQIPPKHTSWETKVKVTSKYPNEFVRLQSFKTDSHSLLLFLPLSDLWGAGVKLYIPPWKQGKSQSWKIEEISLRKHDNYQDFERKNSIYVVLFNLTTHTKHAHKLSKLQ